MNIIQTKPLSIISTVWVALVVLLLLSVSFSPLIARSVTAWDEETRASFLGAKNVSVTEMRGLIAGREKAVEWFRYSGYYNDLSMIALDHFGAAESKKRKAYLENAFYWQDKALKVAPADPYGWFRLAYIFESSRQFEKAAHAWRQSYTSAPYEPRLLLPRLGMARRLESKLGKDAPTLILQLIRQAWDHNPWHLTRMARDDKFLPLAKKALADDPVALKRMDKILREQL